MLNKIIETNSGITFVYNDGSFHFVRAIPGEQKPADLFGQNCTATHMLSGHRPAGPVAKGDVPTAVAAE